MTVIVSSDHGFGPLHQHFFVDKWLMQKGLLKMRRTLSWRLQVTHPPVERVLSKLGLSSLARLLPEKARQLKLPWLKSIPKSWQNRVDWSKTKVYPDDKFGLNVNLKGREPKGIVEPGEAFEALLRDLAAELYGLKDGETGELVVDVVVRKEQIYIGPYVEQWLGQNQAAIAP